MDSSSFMGMLIAAASGLIGLGGVLIAVGKLIQKVDSLRVDIANLSKEMESIDEWKRTITESLQDIKIRVVIVEKLYEKNVEKFYEKKQ